MEFFLISVLLHCDLDINSQVPQLLLSL